MPDPAALPDDVVEALRAGRTIEAIKRLREHRAIGLKEAKDAVDAYVAAHADLTGHAGPAMRMPPMEGLGVRHVLLGVVLAGLGYAVYRLLA